MRRRLTMRGLAFACAAVALGVTAYWTLQGALLVPAVLAAAFVVAGIVLAIAARPDRSVAWSIPAIVTELDRLALPFRIDGAYADGAWRGVTSLDPTPTFWRRLHAPEDRLLVHAPPRGVHRVGPITARRRDPLGITVVRDRLTTTAELVVAPRVTPLTATAVLGHGIDATASRVGQGDLVDQLVRDYRSGDPMRRIHWRQTARQGSLMVRQEQPPATPRAVVVLDTLASGWRDLDEFDEGVRAFASLCLAVSAQGLQVQVVETGYAQIDQRDLASRTRLLEACARLDLVHLPVDAQVAGPAVVVVGKGSAAIDRIVRDLVDGSTVWSVTDDAREVPRRVRHMRWAHGHPVESRWAP